MRNIFSCFWFLLFSLILFGPVLAQESSIRHTILIAGGFTGIVGEDGSEVWKVRGGAKDATQFEDGHILITWKDQVIEYDKDRNQVWSFAKSKDDAELVSAWRLKDGITLVVVLGNRPRLIEVDLSGKLVAEVAIDPEQTDNHHMQTRMARKLENGNYLAPHLFGYSVREYTPKGEIVADFQTDTDHFGGPEAKNWPFTAIRTPQGTTVVGCTYGNRVVEFDSQGKLVWELTNDDVGGVIKDACGVQRLPNGNTVITSYGQRDKDAIKIFEVNPDKKIVWSYKGHHAHHFQILTTNGEPLAGPPMK